MNTPGSGHGKWEVTENFLTRIDRTQSLTEEGRGDKREGNDVQVFSLGVIHEGPGRVSLKVGEVELG